MIKKIVWCFIVILAIFTKACKNSEKEITQNITPNSKFVNPFIGTGGHGHTFPGVVLPNGMVQLSPDTRTEGWDACGGYHYTDNTIKGFSHTHLSGTGIGDLGDFLFMPFTGETKLDAGSEENPNSGYRSSFSHEKEKAIPGFYEVDLLDYNIKAELTATTRVGFHKYTFPDNEEKKLIIDFDHNIHNRNVVNSTVKVISDTEISGYKHIQGWAPNRHIFFYAKFNKPFTNEVYIDKALQDTATEISGRKLLSVLKFQETSNEPLLIKVGISSVDFEGAKKNLEAEINHWDFDKVKQNAQKTWEDQLSQIQVEGGTDTEKTIFYTSLYHTAMAPYIFNDVDGRFRGVDKKIHTSNKTEYTVFSLWDTFRSFHPLINITEPEKNDAFVNTLIGKYEQGGILPKWELNANYTGTMIGYHSIPVIVDTYFKGNKNFDVEKAYKAMLHAASHNVDNIVFETEEVKGNLAPMAKKYNEELGYIPSDLENESVAKALEYAYNDWCIAQMAKDLGKEDDYQKFMERSKRYAKYFDKETGFMRGVQQDGSFREPFDPKFSRHRKDDYTEGNAWQWTWFVPHDVDGLVNLMGGKENFSKKLDELFSTSSKMSGDHVSVDISGLIGQYAHGNEPSHHITHMYNFINEPWKTQKLTDEIMSTLYFNNPNGLSGNEDCGAMSAWYILNAMGFYSFSPGNEEYTLGRPIFNKVRINLKNGKTFTIIANNNNSENKYIQSFKINGKEVRTPFFTHKDILNGATLEFEMGPQENTTFFESK